MSAHDHTFPRSLIHGREEMSPDIEPTALLSFRLIIYLMANIDHFYFEERAWKYQLSSSISEWQSTNLSNYNMLQLH